MNPHDPPVTAALDAAIQQIRATLALVAGRVADQLGALSQSSTRIAERDLMTTTQFELRRQAGALQQAFGRALIDRVRREISPPAAPTQRGGSADWHSLTLVDDHEMDDRLVSDRIGQWIGHACEPELRELATYMGSLMRSGRPDPDRHPLRPEVIGAALVSGIESVSPSPDARQLLVRELGGALAKAMPDCYAQIVQDMQRRGIQAAELSVRQLDGPGYQLPGINSAYQGLDSLRGAPSDFAASTAQGTGSGPSGYGPRSTQGSGSGGGFLRSGGGAVPGSGATRSGATTRSGTSSRSGLSPRQADAQLMALLRHLSASASDLGDLVDASALESHDRRVNDGAEAFDDALPPAAGGLTGLMAVNLIRAHREELRQVSNGKLDHMVIDVVGSLFDQILSDPKVPPQMARQIARLQLPVLRVALHDPSFFSSRRHPVRRFVNRIASLACAFEDFDDGAGKQFLERVRELVQEIVEGDFDQIEVYSAKLALLESYIAEQAVGDVQSQGTASTLNDKEAELRLQQRYMLQLQAALKPLALPDWLRDFLAQVWSQALVLAASRDGPASDRAQRYRRVGRDVVMSVQPKGSPALRKKFLMLLPPLMKDLNEGLALVGWPEAAQRGFFGHLLPAHAESLKAPPQSELDHNLMVKQLESIFAIPVPGCEALTGNDPVPEVDADVLVQRFTPEEAKRVGLVTESAVDWSGPVDIDLGDDAPAEASSSRPGALQGAMASPMLPGIDIDLSLVQADPAEPTRGPQLMEHVKLGFAYQMHMKDEWQKVRLSHVSAGRSFFVFTRGRKHQETISMTARMLARMCETNRFRAVESSYLMERATLRARKQLAALGTATRH